MEIVLVSSIIHSRYWWGKGASEQVLLHSFQSEDAFVVIDHYSYTKSTGYYHAPLRL